MAEPVWGELVKLGAVCVLGWDFLVVSWKWQDCTWDMNSFKLQGMVGTHADLPLLPPLLDLGDLVVFNVVDEGDAPLAFCRLEGFSALRTIGPVTMLSTLPALTANFHGLALLHGDMSMYFKLTTTSDLCRILHGPMVIFIKSIFNHDHVVDHTLVHDIGLILNIMFMT